MSSQQAPSGRGSLEPEPNRNPDLDRGQKALDLLKDLENPENIRKLKDMMANRSWGDVLGLLQDVRGAVNESVTATPAEPDPEPPRERERSAGAESHVIIRESKAKLPDPPIFNNDGDPTWEDWYVDMIVKLQSELSWTEAVRKGYVLSRTGKNVRALVQTKYLNGEYSTADEMFQDLAEAYDDPNKKAKARALYRNLRMNENDRFETFISKFTTYAARAGITDDETKREDLLDKVSKPLREGVRPCLDLLPTYNGLKKKLGLIYWDIEAEKKRSPRAATEKPTPAPARKPNPRMTTAPTNDMKTEKERPKYDDKRKAELSLKGACFNCEQVGHMAKDCPQKGSIKALEANEESGSESGKDDP